MNDVSVAVVGAGWAGLTAALVLTRSGRRVTLIEAGSAPGGRARSLEVEGARLDNGQHILVGACRHALAQMRAVGVNPLTALHPVPFRLTMRRLNPDGEPQTTVIAPRSTRFLHLGGALLEAGRSVGLLRRLRALYGAARMLQHPLRTDQTVADWLRAAGQPPALVDTLWEPLCLAVMNTPLASASALVFQNVLRQTLLGGDAAARLLIPRRPLGDIFPEPALQQLRASGATVHLATRVTAVGALADQGFTLTLRGGETLRVQRVVLAVPPRAARRLLPDSAPLDPLRDLLESLATRSICTVFLRYASPPPELPPLVGLLGQHGQWLVPRRIAGEPRWLAVVISAAEETPMPDARTRWQQVGRELAQSFPGLGEPEDGRVICEPMATLDARSGIEALRPDTRTPLAGLYLAGDYCVKGLPSTLEAAVQSGQKAAAAAIADDFTPV